LPSGRSKEASEGLILNGTHQYLACADDVDLFVENISVIKKKTLCWSLVGKFWR